MAQSPVIRDTVEQLPFGEPRIIFRRIRGRIVPILNKKRIGQDLSALGKVTGLTGAAVLAGATVGKKIRPIRKFRKTTRVFKRISRKSGVFDFSKAKNKLPKKISLAKKITKFATKNPLLIGAGLIATGLIVGAAGFELQAKSKFGARL